MSRYTKIFLPLSLFTLFFQSHTLAQSSTSLIEAATSPLPARLRDGATVLRRETNEVLRAGDNGFICFTDGPGELYSIRCYDESLAPWQRRMSELRNSGVSQPEAMRMTSSEITAGLLEAPKPGALDYIITGPNETDISHLTIVFLGDQNLEGLQSEPDSGHAWIMCSGTPLAHIMIGLQPYSARSRNLSVEYQCGLPEK